MNYAILYKETTSIILEDSKLIYDSSDNGRKKVWVCWWQGYDYMPEIVKVCYNHLIYTLDESLFEIILITADNFERYVNIPKVIINKFQKKIISLTLFSDILREGLLFQNGGLWVDSTVWVEENANYYFSLENNFWSVKLKEIEDQSMWGQLITECKWCGFLIGTKKNSPICGYVFHSMCEYIAKHNYIIDYFLQNLLIRIAYDQMPGVKETIDNIEYSNPNLYKLFRYLNSPYSEDLYRLISEDTSIFKLTYKTNLYENLKEEGKTVYGHLRKKSVDEQLFI
jgi:Capsular polysaccharide synthesis protein.